MIYDLDRHVAVEDYQQLFAHMPTGWAKHLAEREEFVASIQLASNHIRVTEQFDSVEATAPVDQRLTHSLLVPFQGLSVAGWTDPKAAEHFVASFNRLSQHEWAGDAASPALLVSPFDPEWSAREVRHWAATETPKAVAIPLIDRLLGTAYWDPIYAACVEADIPVYLHFSGLEGHYRGAPPLSGAIHHSAASRRALLPHVAETNLASLAFEATFERFPSLRVVVAGFGFSWLPVSLWRFDSEWRTFRRDVPWVKNPPSEYLLESVWLTSWPIQEQVGLDEHSTALSSRMRERLIFGSHSPHLGDDVDTIVAALGQEAADELFVRGREVLGLEAPTASRGVDMGAS